MDWQVVASYFTIKSMDIFYSVGMYMLKFDHTENKKNPFNMHTASRQQLTDYSFVEKASSDKNQNILTIARKSPQQHR